MYRQFRHADPVALPHAAGTGSKLKMTGGSHVWSAARWQRPTIRRVLSGMVAARNVTGLFAFEHHDDVESHQQTARLGGGGRQICWWSVTQAALRTRRTGEPPNSAAVALVLRSRDLKASWRGSLDIEPYREWFGRALSGESVRMCARAMSSTDAATRVSVPESGTDVSIVHAAWRWYWRLADHRVR
jgi:hypothetical protein